MPFSTKPNILREKISHCRRYTRTRICGDGQISQGSAHLGRMAQGSGLLLSVSPRAILLFCVAAVVTLTFYTSHTIHLLTDRLDGVTRLNQQLEKKLALASALVEHHRSVTRLPCPPAMRGGGGRLRRLQSVMDGCTPVSTSG